LLIYC